jgi:hypothetical protein
MKIFTIKKYFSSTGLIIVGMLSLACLFRLLGLGFGLPDAFHPDEHKIVQTAIRFGATGDFNPHDFAYPSLYYYILFFVYLIVYLISRFTLDLSWSQFWQVPLPYPTLMILLARLTTVSFGVGTILVLYKLGKETYGKYIGLLAAFFLSFTYLHVRDSHFGTTDVPMTFLFILTLFYAVRLLQNPEKRNYIRFGIFAGLAAGMKYNAGMICIALLISHFLAMKKLNLPLEQRKKYSYYLGIAAFFAAICFLISTPFALLDFSKFWHDFVQEAKHLRYGHYHIDLGPGWIYHFKFSLFYGLGLPYLITALLGIFWALWKRTAFDYVLVIQVLFYYLWMGSGKTVFPRYMTPIVPLLALFTARFLGEGIEYIPFSLIRNRPKLKVAGAIILGFGILSMSITNFIQFDMLLMQKDTRTLTREWIQLYLPPQTKIATLDRWQGKPQIDKSQYRVVLVGSKGDQPTWLTPEYANHLYVDGNIKILVVDFHPLFYSTPPEKLYAYQPGKIIAEFRPVSNNTPGFGNAVFDPIDAFYVPWAHFKGYLRGGPWIRIYDLS